MDLDKPMQSLDNVLVTYVKKGNKYSEQEKGWILAVYHMYNFVKYGQIQGINTALFQSGNEFLKLTNNNGVQSTYVNTQSLPELTIENINVLKGYFQGKLPPPSQALPAAPLQQGQLAMPQGQRSAAPL